MHRRSVRLAAGLLLLSSIADAAAIDPRYARDPNQPVDAWYGERIAKYTTDARFNTPLTDYLPKSDTVPTPAKVLNGDVAGAPDYLPYIADVHRYFRMLDEASPRVKVFSIGKSEEGREMIAVAIADEKLIEDFDANRARMKQLADPRVLDFDDAKAAELIAATTPVYYLTGALHSNETGSPTSLMELAYRLAVDDAPYIKEIRSRVITVMTPVVEVDGRDRMVDLYNWHRANPGKFYPRLMYWGKYVAHDNNRDAMGMTLALTRHVLDAYLDVGAIVLHDLHESVPFLYDNTVGDGPYNAWIDPILVGEWQQLGWNNVQELTRLGLPGVYTHGNFDTWSPGYLMFLAAMHNGISRLYETFGNGGADTEERQLDPDEYARTWYRPNPPEPKVLWSQRNNNNYTQSGLLTALSYFAQNDKDFLRNFWAKGKRSIAKPNEGGPAAYILPADDAHRASQAALLRVLRLQKVEVHVADEAITVDVPIASAEAGDDASKRGDADSKSDDDASSDDAKDEPKFAKRTFPRGSFVVRMDQPYSRIADTLLDRQYWAPDDPQKQPYDDTGWSLGDLFGSEVVRVVDVGVLKAPMTRRDEIAIEEAGVRGDGGVYLVAGSASPTLIGLRYALRDAKVSAAKTSFDAGGRTFPAGTLIVRDVARDVLDRVARERDLAVLAVPRAPEVATHEVGRARIALMHTWLSTQTEGWWRLALDRAQVPYDYISTQDVAKLGDLRDRYDVILFGPTDYGSTSLILDGLPRHGNAMPWKKTALTPNLGTIDETDDIRPGLGARGLEALKAFVADGGLLVTSGDTAQFAIDTGLAPGVKYVEAENARVVGSILRGVTVADDSAVAFGYGEKFALYSPDGASFALSNSVTGRSYPNAKSFKRPTGRGGPDDHDLPQNRAQAEPPELPSPKAWEAQELTDEQRRNNLFALPPGAAPRTIVRFGDSDGLLLSGLLADAGEIAQKPVVVDARYGRGHTLLFAINPLWRGQTVGNYALVFNAILHWNRLDAEPASTAAR